MNFKKNGIFGRREDGGQTGQAPDLYGAPNQVLAVWGSPGSGKSTVAVKLARYLAGKKKNVILVLCDMTAPMLPCICQPGELECEHSLGSILAAVRVSESLVKHNLITHKKYGGLTFLGMLKGENEYTYPPFTASQASELLQCLKGIAPYIIIDCGSYIANDILSAVALMESDAVLRLVNCDLKSISYLSSQLPLLRDNKWDADKQYKVASNVRTDEASDHAEQVLGNVTFRFCCIVEHLLHTPGQGGQDGLIKQGIQSRQHQCADHHCHQDLDGRIYESFPFLVLQCHIS